MTCKLAKITVFLFSCQLFFSAWTYGQEVTPNSVDPNPDCLNGEACIDEPPPPPPPTAQCVGNDELESLQIARIPKGADGKIHVKYGFFDANMNSVQPSPEFAEAFSAAFADWNSKSGSTHVIFELAGQNDRPNIPIVASDDAAANGGCVAINPSTGFMNYSSAFSVLVGTKPGDATAAAKHEIAHFVGLEHIPYSNNVKSVASGNAGTCLNPIFQTSTVQPMDATIASHCVDQALTLAEKDEANTGGGGAQMPGYTKVAYGIGCTYYYTAYDIFYWYDGWHYVGTVYMFNYSSCE